MEKGYLYIGHYKDMEGNYILKVGTTNNLKRRRSQHNRDYKKVKTHMMPVDETFEYDWFIEMSKYSTSRYEDMTKASWIEANIGEHLRNDRFVCKVKPTVVKVKIKKTYEIYL